MVGVQVETILNRDRAERLLLTERRIVCDANIGHGRRAGGFELDAVFFSDRLHAVDQRWP